MSARKAPHLKLLSGTSRPDRVLPAGVSLPPLDVSPEPPDWLPNAHAVREWNRLLPVMMANRLLNAGNVGLFAQMCALHGHLVTAWATGEAPTAAMISTHRATCAALGLLGMTLPEPAAKPNVFSNNRR